MKSQTRIFSCLVDDFLKTNALIVPASENLRLVISRMAEKNASCVLATDEEGKLTGIFTEKDVTHRVDLRCDGTETMEQVMTSRVYSAKQGDYLYHTIARMRRLGHRHMPVVDEANRPLGLLDLQDAMAVAAANVVEHIDALTQVPELYGLQEVKAVQAVVAQELLEDNLPAPEIQALLTHVNNDIYRQVVEKVVSTIEKAGGGTPPVRYAVIVMGSSGRGENFINPDQDNGIILEDYPVERHNEVNDYFIQFSELLTWNLEAIGFPLCDGNVMATNPLWRKPISEWKLQTLRWFQKRSTFQVQLSDVFFDFDTACGDLALGRELRNHITTFVQKEPAVLQAMFQTENDRHVALGLFGILRTEKVEEGLPQAINIKHGGILPFVGAVRLLALKEGIEATSTYERIRLLHKAEVFSDDEVDDYTAALEHLTFILLRQQLRDFRRIRKATRYVRKSAMSRREKQVLKMSLKAVRSLKERVRSEFTGEIL